MIDIAVTDTDIDKIIQSHNLIFKYNNIDSAKQTISEIFDDEIYKFISDKPEPIIIDAGSNIGVAMLYFKHLYPSSKILCFEPDPNAYKALLMNIEQNNIKDVETVHAALSKVEGSIGFYGQINMVSPDARGNSIIQSWGLQRAVSNKISIPSVLLSSYITGEIDFLKLDIEGAEQQVIEGLVENNKLRHIKAISLEVHQTAHMTLINDMSYISSVLVSNRFQVTIVKKITRDIFPEATKDWVMQNNPLMYDIQAIRLDL